jgi:aspartyl-tRNA(Asn)/glutamyl-tRNA(Gln) amidotransferase subunit C
MTVVRVSAPEINLKYVAHLARLGLSPEEEAGLAGQLAEVLQYMDKLKELDVSQVEPMAHAFPIVNVTRPDETSPSLTQAEALANAPAQANGLFIVPRIVE